MSLQADSQSRAVSKRATGSLPARGQRGAAMPVPTMDTVPAAKTEAFPTLRRNSRLGVLALIILAAGLIGLLTQVVIAGAVISSGVLVVEGGPKLVQHPIGGIVTSIDVEEGDTVKEGQVLLTLDRTTAEARVFSYVTTLVQQKARLARLIAERDNQTEVVFSDVTRPPDMTEAAYTAILDGERQQFVLRREQREGERAQLEQQQAQLEGQVTGQQDQINAIDDQIAIVKDRLDKMQSLLKKQIVTQQQVSDLDRQLSVLEGQKAAMRAQSVSFAGKIAENKVQILQVDQRLRSDLTDQLASANAQIAQLEAQLATARAQLDQTTIRAPQSGVVLGLTVHTVGGVAGAGETLMTIVPTNDSLVGEVKVSAADIDQLYPGQTATVNFSAFDRGTTPTLIGHVKSISADLLTDQRTGQMYYKVLVMADPEEMIKLNGLKLVPGMPIEVFIRTNSRTIASYVTKPLTDQINRAFR